MIEHWTNDNFHIVKEKLMPVQIKDQKGISNANELLNEKVACISFSQEHCSQFLEKGSFIVLDFGKELCGGIRIITRAVDGNADFRITFGESLTEALSSIGEKNATNNHSPRDMEVEVPQLSDLTFGQTGFRFVRIELLSEKTVQVRNIFAINTLPYFEKEAIIKTSDEELNKIIETAAYTLKLNFQNGYIWDGIKRDRLVWCGDLHQEIVTSLYLFGDNQNIPNSLSFLRNETPGDQWINRIPTYSAWWVINLCDYCLMTGNMDYWKKHFDYAEEIFDHIDENVDETGIMHFEDDGCGMPYFLDWPTFQTEDAKIGTAALIILAAKKFLALQENEKCHSLIKKLENYLDMPCESKQVRAFQILAGRCAENEATFLEDKGAFGYSTFMAYYLLLADALAGGENTLSIIKEYFGAMLSRGATTFWEDFDMEWLDGSGRIDEIPAEGVKDIHGDFGAYCYINFRHSLCHGWASGVLSFVIEHIFGLHIQGDEYTVTPHPLGIERLYAKIPVKDGWLEIQIENGNITTNEIS